jgi:DNA-binding FadR family transcriptional regulator
MLTRIWPLVESQIRMAISLDQATRHDPDRDAELHRRLIAVIEAGDPDDITAEVRVHIEGSADEFVQLLEGKFSS